MSGKDNVRKKGFALVPRKLYFQRSSSIVTGYHASGAVVRQKSGGEAAHPTTAMKQRVKVGGGRTKPCPSKVCSSVTYLL